VAPHALAAVDDVPCPRVFLDEPLQAALDLAATGGERESSHDDKHQNDLQV
jgi:hypothetical protein